MELIKKIKNERFFLIGSPAIVWQCLFFFLPLLLMMLSSVIDSTTSTFTLENFSAALSGTHLSIILRSLSLSLSVAIITFLLAYPLAHFIIFHAKKYKSLFLFFLIVPFWTNILLHVYAWFFVLEKEGFLNTFLLTIGAISEPIHFLNSIFAIVLMMVYCYFPFMVLPIVSSLERFDKHFIEASHDLGASRFQTLFKVTIPINMPAIRAGFFLVFIPAFGEFMIPELMGGDKHYFVGSVVSKYVLGNNTETLGSAFMILSALVLMLVGTLIYSLFNKMTSRGYR